MQVPTQLPGSEAKKVAILSASPIPEDHVTLEGIFTGCAPDAGPQSTWQLVGAATLASAMGEMKQFQFPVVLCERDQPAGDWRDLLEYANRLAHPPFVVVTSRLADECFWAEALNLGAYDVLAKPFHASDVIWVVSLACLRWQQDRLDAAPKTHASHAGIRRAGAS